MSFRDKILILIGVIVVVLVLGGMLIVSLGGVRQRELEYAPGAPTAPSPSKEEIVGPEEVEKVTPEAEKEITRLVIKSGELNIVVKDVVSIAKKIIEYAQEQGGWVVSSDVKEVEKVPIGTVTIRIPAEKFDAAMDFIKGLAQKVEYEGRKGEDVTEEYVDLNSKLKTLRATKEQFYKIMKMAKKIDEILRIQSEIEKVQGEIDQTEGRMRYLRESARMGKISVNLALSEELLPVPPAEKWRPGYVAKKAWQETLKFWRNVSYGVIEFFVKHLLTWILVLAIIVGILWRPVKKGLKKIEERKVEVKKEEKIGPPSGLALASLICGIVGVLFIFTRSMWGLLLGIAALVMGIKEKQRGYAKAGFILGIIAIVLGILVLMSSGGVRPLIPE